MTGVLRDLRSRRVRVQSLADSEAPWIGHLFAEEGSAEALIGDLLASVLSWVADAERQATVRRTRAGLARVRAEGKTLCRPWSASPELRNLAVALRSSRLPYTEIARQVGKPRSTIRHWRRIAGVP